MAKRSYKYIFKFEDQNQMEFELNFDKDNNLLEDTEKTNKDWTKLENKKCQNCTLNSEDHPLCPVAKNLDHIVELTKEKLSYEKAKVIIQTPERYYMKDTDTQEGLLSLFGVIMASSGCPHLGWFKPLVRFHLPFSTLEETMFRVLSMHLVTEFLSTDQSDDQTFDIQELKNRYAEVEKVNTDFISRINSHCKGDADKNAIAALDLFAKLFDYEVDANFKTLIPLFK